MRDLDYILDFSAKLGAAMLGCGATLERADDTMRRICKSYRLTEVSIFSLNSIIQISATDPDGQTAIRQIAAPGWEIHMKRLDYLNRLSRKVCRTMPVPETLPGMLAQAESVPEYPDGVRLCGRIISTASLCGLYGGSFADMLASEIIILILMGMTDAMGRVNLNRVIRNMVCMFTAGSLGFLLIWLGLGDDYFIVLITCSMLLIPGIPLVNAARNLLCGNEMNGILEILKALIEALAIVLGICASIFLFGGLVL